MNTVACKKLNLDWAKAYGTATGQSASAVVDKALDDYRRTHDLAVDIELAEAKLTNALIELYDFKEQAKMVVTEEEAFARKAITAHLKEVRSSKEFKRNLIRQDAFNQELKDWLLANICPSSGVRIERALQIAKSIWVILEVESRKKADEPDGATAPSN